MIVLLEPFEVHSPRFQSSREVESVQAVVGVLKMFTRELNTLSSRLMLHLRYLLIHSESLYTFVARFFKNSLSGTLMLYIQAMAVARNE